MPNLKKNKLLLMVGYKCNNNCIFCSADSFNKSHINRSTQEIIKEIVSSSNKYNSIEFIGGEFTIRKDAFFLVSVAKRSGYNLISIETNGRMFAGKEFSNKIIRAGLNRITFSIHGAKAETHDRITRVKNSFVECTKGLKNLDKFNLHICINFVITRSNYREIPIFLEKMERFHNVKEIFFSFIRPIDYLSTSILKDTVPSFTEILPFLKAVANNKKAKIQYIPKCIFNSEKVIDQNHKIYVDKNYGFFEENSNLYLSLKNEFIKKRFCKNCRENKNCIGILKNYYTLFNKNEFKPL